MIDFVFGSKQPGKISNIGGPVEAEFEPEYAQRLRRRLLAEDRRGDVARQYLSANENQHRNCEERQDTEGGPCCDETSHGLPFSFARSARLGSREPALFGAALVRHELLVSAGTGSSPVAESATP